MKIRKYLAGILPCLLLAVSMSVMADEPMPKDSETGFVFANTKGLLMGVVYKDAPEVSGTDTAAVSEETSQERNDMEAAWAEAAAEAAAWAEAAVLEETSQKSNDINNSEQVSKNSQEPQIPASVPEDYNNVEMGDNMLQASVDGTKITFYLESAGSASDGYELRYISFTPEGEPQYCIYLRIPLGAQAGSYTSGKGYFSISTSYNEEKKQWNSSYKALYDGKGEEGKHGSSSFTGNWGSYRLTLNQDMGWEGKEISGTLTAKMEGFSTTTKGKTINIEDGVFRAVKGETHQIVQDWQSGSLTGSVEGWVDPYAKTDKQEKKICSKCGGNGRIICSYCDGAGTLLKRKEGIDLGSGSTGYTVEVDCAACNNGYIECSRCSGSGYVY